MFKPRGDELIGDDPSLTSYVNNVEHIINNCQFGYESIRPGDTFFTLSYGLGSLPNSNIISLRANYYGEDKNLELSSVKLGDNLQGYGLCGPLVTYFFMKIRYYLYVNSIDPPLYGEVYVSPEKKEKMQAAIRCYVQSFGRIGLTLTQEPNDTQDSDTIYIGFQRVIKIPYIPSLYVFYATSSRIVWRISKDGVYFFSQ